METLTVEEIRTLQLALDNMASDGMLDSGIQKMVALHNKLDRIAAQQSVHLTLCGRCQNPVTEQNVYCPKCGQWNPANRR